MVFSAISQLVTATQFYLYGKNHFTQVGWNNAIKSYDVPDLLSDENLKLHEKVYMITGANAGINLFILLIYISCDSFDLMLLNFIKCFQE